MKCFKCGYILKKEDIGVVNYYLITPNKILFEKRELYCPICGCVLAQKEFNKELRGGVSDEANES